MTVAWRLGAVATLMMLLGSGPALKRDWSAVAIVALVVLVATMALWLWALSDMTGGWYG